MEELQIQSGELLFNSKQKGHISAAHGDAKNKKSKELFCNTFVYEPTNISEKVLGNLYMVGEVDLPHKSQQHNSSYLINLIASIIKREYYCDPKRSPLESIESALVKANFALSDFAENGNINWMHHLHFVIATIADNVLHLTQTGYAKCLLLREEEITDIGKSLPSKEKDFNPLKTFLHVASGTIEINDKILITTPEMFNILSLEKLRRIILAGNVKDNIKELQNIIEENDSPGATGFIIIKIQEKESLQNAKNDISHVNFQSPRDADIEQAYAEKFNNEELPKSEENNIAEQASSKIISLSLKILAKIYELAKIYFIAFLKLLANLIVKLYKAAIKKLKDKKDNAAENNSENKKEKTPFKFREIHTRAINILTNYIKSFQNLPKKKKLAVYIFISLIIFFSIGTFGISRKKENSEFAYKQQAEALANETQQKIAKAENSLSINDFDQTKKLLDEANSSIEQLKQNSKDNAYNERIQQFTASSKDIYNKLHKITEISQPEFIGKMPIDTQKCVKIKDTLYCYGLSSNSLYKLNILEEKNIITDIENEIGNNFESIAAIDNTLILLTKKPSIIIYNTDTEKSSALDLKIVDPIIAMDSYGKYLYFITSKNEIIKASGVLSGQIITSKWIKKENLETLFASDITLDGDIFVANSDGSISKYSSGEFVTNFNIGNLDKFASPEILTNANTNYLYFLDKVQQRIIICDKQGVLSKQILSDELNNLKNIFLESNNSIYILNADKIYKITADIK